MNRTLSCISMLILFSTAAFAHYPHFESYNSLAHFGPHEIKLNLGMGTTDQYLGILNSHETGFDFPNVMSGADFISYRYYVANWFAVGATAGADYQAGNMTNYSRSYDNRKTGKYERGAYTLAAECAFIFMDKHRFQMYTGLGIGYTYYTATGRYDDDYYQYLYYYQYYYSPANMPPQVIHYRETHINGQVTMLGIKSNGPFSVCFELGLGYKGLLGLSFAYRL